MTICLCRYKTGNHGMYLYLVTYHQATFRQKRSESAAGLMQAKKKMIWCCVICFVFVALAAHSRSPVELFVELTDAPKSIECTTHYGITLEETTTRTWKVAAATHREREQQ